MVRRWSAKDRRLFTRLLVCTGVAILFALVGKTPMERWIAWGAVLLCVMGITAYVLRRLGLFREPEVSEQVAQQREFQRLARARIKEITGLVYGNIYGLDRPVREPQPCFSMKEWRVRHRWLRTGYVTVYRAGELKFSGSPPLVPSYSVLRFRARMRTNFLGIGEALLEEIVGIDTSDAGLNRVRESLNLVSIEDPVLGTLTEGRSVDAWFGLSTWMGSGISVTLSLGKDADPDALRKCQGVVNLLWQNQDHWNRAIRDFVVNTMLPEWNAERGENEEPLTARQFEDGMVLDSIEVFANGNFQFGYGHSDLSPADGFVVEGSLSEGTKEAYLTGI